MESEHYKEQSVPEARFHKSFYIHKNAQDSRDPACIEQDLQKIIVNMDHTVNACLELALRVVIAVITETERVLKYNGQSISEV